MATKYTVTLTAVDDFSGRSKVRFGVGEELTLSVKEEPAAQPATKMAWSVKSGAATVTAGNTPGSASVKVGAKPGAVVLELHNTDTNTLLASKRFEAVAPDGATFEKSKDLNVKHGAGFVGKILLQPNDVSFKWCEMREGEAPYEGTGCFAKAQVALKDVATSYAVIHPVMGKWVKCSGGTAKGSLMIGQDTVNSAIPKDYGDGGVFKWTIPWFYRVDGGGETRFCTAVHQETVDKKGKMTISKLNIKISKQL